jgi:hypothetical protein
MYNNDFSWKNNPDVSERRKKLGAAIAGAVGIAAIIAILYALFNRQNKQKRF